MQQPLLSTVLLVACLAAAPAGAAISGRVIVARSDIPIAGARVHLQADVAPVAITGADGTFTLAVEPSGTVIVTAGVPYASERAENFATNGALARNGATAVTIELEPIPEEDNQDYEPIRAEPPNACGDCHELQLEQWRGSAHARAATNAWVRDLYSGDGTPGGGAGYVFRDTHDPDDTGFCATCHAPIAEARAPGAIFFDEVDGDSALEGVNCSACHTIDQVGTNVDALHLLGNATMRFPLDGIGGIGTHEYVWGPLDDVNYTFMKSSYAPVFSDSRYCASCHEYANPETGAPGQRTYTEWLASPYAVPGPGFRSCQNCHMREMEAGTIADPPPLFQGIEVIRAPTQRHRHDFVGATAAGLRGAIELVVAAEAGLGELHVEAQVANAGAGHAFPTGISLRNALLVIRADVGGIAAEQTSGPVVPFWADDDVPGVQEGDYAGHAGKGFAKILEGRINGAGDPMSPVLFIDAERVLADTTIAAGTTDTTRVIFSLPADSRVGATIHVEARLLYRRAFRALAVAKGWTETPSGGPIEVEVSRSDRSWQLAAADLAPTATPIPVNCTGDCDASGGVTVDEIVTGVAIALGSRSLSDCDRFDASGDGEVTVDEILTAINAALEGCPAL